MGANGTGDRMRAVTCRCSVHLWNASDSTASRAVPPGAEGTSAYAGSGRPKSGEEPGARSGKHHMSSSIVTFFSVTCLQSSESLLGLKRGFSIASVSREPA